jgi:glycosyltransferase involved in cell wall biosynthesis
MANILVIGENPRLQTGQGRIGHDVAMALYKAGHGVFYNAWCPSEVNRNKKLPFNVIYAVEDYGSAMFGDLIRENRPDIVLTIGDIWNFAYIGQSPVRGLFKWVSYCAVDGTGYGGGMPKHHATHLGHADHIITYCEYGRRAVIHTIPEVTNRIERIYHGINEKVFHPISKEERTKLRQELNIPPDKFLCLYTGRTHFRKSLADVMKAYKILMDCGHDKDYGLWINSNFADPQGYNINMLIAEFGLQNKVYTFKQMSEASTPLLMMTEKEYNLLFGIADCLINVAGEGFGYNVAEAMMAKLPVITIDNAATGELAGNGRGIKVKPTAYITGMELTERPLANPKDIAKAIIEMKSMKAEKRNAMVDKAYDWAKENLSQGVIDMQWKKVIDKIEHPLKYNVVMEMV